MKPVVFLTVVAALVTYIFVSGAGTLAGVGEGRLAPTFTVKNLAGEAIALADMKGRVVLLNFWRTDCAPCAAEMPDMELVATHFKGRKFEMMPVSLDSDADAVARFYREQNLTMPAYHDPYKRVAGKYNVRATPETFLIDSNGKIAKYYIGPKQWASPQMLAVLNAMIPE